MAEAPAPDLYMALAAATERVLREYRDDNEARLLVAAIAAEGAARRLREVAQIAWRDAERPNA